MINFRHTFNEEEILKNKKIISRLKIKEEVKFD